MPTDRIGMIGLGAMGLPIATNLLRAGYEMAVYSRRHSVTNQLEAAGARRAVSPYDLARGVDILITCLPDDCAVDDVLGGEGGAGEALPKEAVFIDMGTGSAKRARERAVLLAARGVHALDAPTSGGDSGAQAGTLTIMVGGAEPAFRRCLPIFSAVGKRITHMGAAGSGQVAKACNQTIVAATMIGVGEALLLARESGLEARDVVDAISAGSANCWTLTARAPRLLAGDRRPGMRARLFLKDLELVSEAAGNAGITLPVVNIARELYSSMVERGNGDIDNSAIADLLAQLSGKKIWSE